MDKLDLIDTYRAFHPKTMDFTFLSSAHRTFSRMDHILGHKSSLGKFLKIEIILSIFSDHNALSSVQFSSVAQSCPTLCDPMNCSTPGLPVHHQLPEFTQTNVHRAISSSVVPFFSCPQFLPASGSFPISQHFT